MAKMLRLTQFAIDRAPEAIARIGSDGRYLYVNDATCSSLGYSREELLSMTAHDIGPNFPKEAWPDHWEEVKQRGSLTFESPHRKLDGRVIPVEITVNYLKFEEEEYNYAFARDITERKRAEEALRRSEGEARRLAQESAIMAEVGRIISSTLNIEEVYDCFAKDNYSIIGF